MQESLSLRDAWLVLHLASFAIGTGTAIFTDILFVRAIRRPAAGRWNAEVMSVGSVVIWSVLLLIVISGVALTLPRAGELLRSARFLTKMFVVAVIVVNGARLHLVLTPRLTEAFFRVGATSAGSVALPALRRQAFVAGAVSSSSWLGAIALAALPDLDGAPALYPLSYLALLGGAAGAALLADLVYARTLGRVSAITTKEVAQKLLEEVDVYETWFSRPKSQDD